MFKEPWDRMVRLFDELNPNGNGALTSVSLPNLATLTGNTTGINLTNNALLTNASFPSLTGMTSGLRIQTNGSLANLDGLSALTSANRLEIIGNNALTDRSYPRLKMG